MDMLTKEIAIRQNAIDFQAIGASYLPNPDLVLKKQGKDITVYKELTTDGHLSGCITSRKAGVKSLKWELQRNEAPDAVFKTITKMLNALQIDKIISEILDCVQYGYQISEVLWEKKDGVIAPANIIGKPQNWFVFSESNELKLLTKTNQTQGIELPPKKFLLSTYNATYENPYGDPLLSKCFWPVTFKKGGMKFWITFCEKYGMPYLFGKIKRGAPPTEYDELLEKLEAMVQDAIAVIPDDASVQFVESESKSGASDIFNSLIEACNTEISIAQLGQNLTTEVKDGSYAAAQSHMQVRDDIVESDKKIVEQAFNTLISWICELNFNETARPKFNLWKEEDIDKTLAERDEVLTKSGVKFTKKYFIKTYGFEEEDIIVSEETADAKPQAKDTASFAEKIKQKFTPNQQAIEELVDSSLTASEHAFNKLLKPVQDMIKRAESIEEVRDKLFSMYKDMDKDEISDILARAMFISELWGRVNGSDSGL